MRPIIIACLLLANLILANAQDTRPALRQYIAKDSVYSMGIVTIISDFKIEYRASKKSAPIQYGPDEVTEFATSENTYLTLSLDGKKKFYKVLQSGNATLLVGHGKIILKIDTLLHQITKANYKEIFATRLPAQGTDRGLSRLYYTQASLSRYVKNANKGILFSQGLTYRRVGAYGNVDMTNYSIIPEHNLQQELVAEQTNFSPSIFLEAPLSRREAFSLEAIFSNASLFALDEKATTTSSVKMNVRNVTISPGVKMFLSQRGIKPYIKLAYGLSLINISAVSPFVTTSENDNPSIIETQIHSFEAVRGLQHSFLPGAGVELNMPKRKTIHIGVGYNLTLNKSFSDFTLKQSGTSLYAGFSF